MTEWQLSDEGGKEKQGGITTKGPAGQQICGFGKENIFHLAATKV